MRFDKNQTGHENMARDAAMLEEAENGASSCRIYTWDAPWVTLGRFQNPERDLVDPKYQLWARRPTGGKAVLHGHDVTIAIAAPLAAVTADGGRDARLLRPVYRALARPLIASLRQAGLPAALGEETRFVSSGPRVASCFAHVSPNDIVDERTGVKVCGCALRLTQTAVLLQASVPNGTPLVDPETVIVGAEPLPVFTWEHEVFVDAMRAVSIWS